MKQFNISMKVQKRMAENRDKIVFMTDSIMYGGFTEKTRSESEIDEYTFWLSPYLKRKRIKELRKDLEDIQLIIKQCGKELENMLGLRKAIIISLNSTYGIFGLYGILGQ
jgi:DNA helicase IV